MPRERGRRAEVKPQKAKNAKLDAQTEPRQRRLASGSTSLQARATEWQRAGRGAQKAQRADGLTDTKAAPTVQDPGKTTRRPPCCGREKHGGGEDASEPNARTARDTGDGERAGARPSERRQSVQQKPVPNL